MVDEKQAGEGEAVTTEDKGALESAVDQVRAENEDKVPFKVLEEESPSGARRKVRVEVDQAEWDTRLEEMFKNVKSQATVPGFRKGKAPLSLLKKRYRDGAVNELVEKISPKIVSEYEADKKLTVYGTPTITAYEAEDGKPVTITFEMEIKPEIEPKNYKGIEVESADHKLPADAVESRLNEMREQAAVYNEVERGFKSGDGVVIDYKITGEKGKTLNHKSNQFIENPEQAMQKEVVDELEGKKADDQFEVKVEEIHYSITVKAVKEKQVPEINDDFAKDLGYADEKELRAKTEEELQKIVDNNKADDAFEALTLKLVESHDFDIPEALKQHVQKEMADSDMQYVRQTGYRPPRLQDIEGPEDYGKILDKDSVQRVKGFLLIDAIGLKENIVVEDADIDKALEEKAAESGRKPVAVRAAMERNRQWAQFLEQVRFEKIREFLLKENKVKYVEPKEEKADAAEDDKPAEPKKKAAKAKAEDGKAEAPKKAAAKKKKDADADAE